uniref:LUC7 related protein n=1 Tax=Oryza rufipogon TaxID=4529 RepID=A0A0E0P3S4_ORYRU
MDAMRKQLDVLMGANRKTATGNGDVREVSRKYYDRDVCRLFLAGLCPHDLFQLTKMDLGPCPKVHSLQLRKDYEEVKAKGTENYDRELEEMIDRLIVECERKIQRALKRLADEDAKAAIAISVSEVTQTDEVLQLSKEIKEKMKEVDTYGKTDDKIKTMEVVEELRSKRADMQATLLLDAFNKDRASLPQPTPTPQMASVPAPAPPDARTQEMINEKIKKAEELGEQGMVDEAQKVMEEAEALKKLAARREPTSDPTKYTAADVRITDQKLRLCDICGAFLSVYDNDRRLADHFGGKLHLGYMLIREKLKELQGTVATTLVVTGTSQCCIIGISSMLHNWNLMCQSSLLSMGTTAVMRREVKEGRHLKMTGDQENTARTAMVRHPGIEIQKERTELNLEKAEETMIVIGIGATIGTAAMIAIGIEIMTVRVAMIQGEGNVLDPGSAGATIDTESGAP